MILVCADPVYYTGKAGIHILAEIFSDMLSTFRCGSEVHDHSAAAPVSGEAALEEESRRRHSRDQGKIL